MGAGKQPTYGLKPEHKSTVKILFLTASLLSFIHSLIRGLSLCLSLDLMGTLAIHKPSSSTPKENSLVLSQSHPKTTPGREDGSLWTQ